MPKATCCLPRWFGVFIGWFLGLISVPSAGWAQIVTVLNSSVCYPILAVHTKQHVDASLEPLLTGTTLGKAVSADRIIAPQEQTPIRWLRRATSLRVVIIQF
ncbi:hypothetical protein [Hymenobacter sp. GOD-10R]|uniref:hypothetical protein n=1 Tax=Hymenobacter sp. GOD-10R TaxID=3093922 RepID=UPI002D76AF6A|nr:hypothetical protein [Hymenobacter sp. GOD-10R]WRQ28157.1 hypothetical protein SD425_24130 [Hymenobacter sp. GOD-10R]